MRQRSRSRSRGRPRSASKAAKSSNNVSSEEKKSPITKKRQSVSAGRSVSDGSSTWYDSDSPIRVSRRLQEKVQKQIDESSVMVRNRGKVSGDAATVKQTVVKDDVTSHDDVIGFGGATGGAALSILLPALIYLIVLTCDKSNGCTVTRMPSCPLSLAAFFDLNVFGVLLAWYLYLAVLAVLPIGPEATGQPLSSGKRLSYRCNGFLSLLLSVVLFAVAYYLEAPVDYIYNHWLQFLTASIVYSYIIAVGLYIKALYAPASQLAPESTGSLFNDFFMGRELNPRIGNLDLKFFLELRPGLIGWMFVDWCLCAAQYKQTGSVLPALALVTIFQTIYVFDALKHESAILTTMDITTEGLGFMLVFGDLAWVPGLYTLQAHFLYTFPQYAVSNVYALVAIILVEVTGLIIFRGANSQKNSFRNNPNSPSVAHLATIATSTGKRLLCSGYWGICRRPNYLGDLLMALAWSLTCGSTHLLPYFYPVYFFILLVHRQIRDEAYCRKKYGSAWDKYCREVPYRIVPYVF